MKYGFCLNHPNKLARNAKRLCDTCTRERHERSAESKGLTVKNKEYGIDNTSRYKFQKQSEKVLQKNPIAFKKTKIKHRSDKNKELVKQELLVFKKIWESRPYFCEWCGTPITVFNPINYHHIKTKGAFPELRLVESNIVKICAECHIKEHGFNPRKNDKENINTNKD